MNGSEVTSLRRIPQAVSFTSYLSSKSLKLLSHAEIRRSFHIKCPLFFFDLNQNGIGLQTLVKAINIKLPVHENSFSYFRVITCERQTGMANFVAHASGLL
jgi:hypothetical protein